jgi:hypothetical protein
MNDATNQDISRLKQMLEEITASDTLAADHPGPAGDASSQPRDVESASMREAWLAFGQLIDAADASLPAMSSLDTPLERWKDTSTAPQSPRYTRWLGLVAATAAVLLVAVTLGWWISRDSKPGDRDPSLARTAMPEQAVPQIETRTATAAPLVKQEQPKPVVARAETAAKQTVANHKATAGTTKPATKNPSVWDDPLETQIASVSRQINNVARNWQHRVDDVDLVQYRIDEVAESLQNDAL